MVTIGQLASYAGVTQRTVRHYHQVGLLPEPARDASGYRTYDARDVVRLIRVRTLAEAGVPLARVQELLDADEAELAAAVAEIDQRLRAEVRALQEHRRRIARLAAGDSLALPAEVVAYLDRLRAGGVPEQMVEGERDGWILMAARWPDRIAEFMISKNAQLEDPRTLALYRLLGEVLTEDAAQPGGVVGEDARHEEIVDLMVAMFEDAAAKGELDADDLSMADDAFVALVDSYATGSHPFVERLQRMLADRGWAGWTRVERAGGRDG